MMTSVERTWLKIAIALLVVVTGFAAYLFWPRPDDLARLKAQMRARGEKLTLAEVAPSFSPEKLDWANQLQPAVAGILSQPVPPGAVDMMVSLTPGYAVPAWQRPFANETPKTNHTWEALAEQVADSGDALHALHELLSKVPAGSVTDYSDPANLPGGINLVTLRRAAQSLSLATLNDLHRGSLPSALTNIHGLIAFTQVQEEAGLLVDQMIRSAIAGLGVAATWEALQAPGWNDAQLAELDAAWAKVELVKQMTRTFEMERAWASELFQHARTNSGGPGALVGASPNGVERFVNDQVVTPLWQKSWSQEDELFYHRVMQSFGDGVRDAVTNRSWQRVRARLDSAEATMKNITAVDEFRYQFSAAVMPNWNKAIKTLLRHQSQIQMARAAIAIERHRLKHGRVPESLAKLVPEFLHEMPVDYMTGRPLLFAVNPNGSFALYSAGEDGRDDDGLGDDVVWPQAELPTRAVGPTPGEKILALTFQDAPPREVLDKLGQKAGLELRYQAKALEKLPAKFSLNLNEISAAEALETALHRLNLALVQGPKQSNHCVVVNPFTRKER